MSLKLTTAQLQYFLEQKGLQPKYQEETDQIFIAINKSGLEMILFFRIASHAALLQIVAYPPIQVHPNTMPELARVLHQINRDLDVPGFCLDENNQLVFFRVVIPCMQQRFDEELLEAYIKTIPEICHTFYSLIYTISEGKQTFEELFHNPSENEES